MAIDFLATKQWKCPECGHLGSYYADDSIYMACTQCQYVSKRVGSEYVKQWKNSNKHSEIDQIIPLGAYVHLPETGNATVLGFIIRTETKHNTSWTEYYLKNIKGEQFFLTEFEGHWHLLYEHSELTELALKHAKQKVETIKFEGQTFKLFNYSYFNTNKLVGEINYRISTTNQYYIREFICPPYIISEEFDRNSIPDSVSFIGRYVPLSELTNAVKSNKNIVWNKPQGIGFAQPNPYKSSASKELMILACFIGLLFLTNEFFNRIYRADKKVFSTNFRLTDSTARQTIATDHFMLEGHASEVEIEAIQYVENSWSYLNISLVNAQTDVERNFEIELDAYKGYTNGEHWSDGSNNVSKNLNQVETGEYYLVINTDVDAGGSIARDVFVNVYWQPQKVWNMWWSIILIGIYFFIIEDQYGKAELKRWKNSYKIYYEN